MWLFSVLLLIFLVGAALIQLINVKLYLLEKIGLSWLLGIGLFTLSLFLTNLLGVPFNLYGMLFLLLLSDLFLWLLVLKVRKKKLEYASFQKVFSDMIIEARNFWDKSSVVAKSFSVLSLFLLSSAFVFSLYWPVRTWDALAVYDFRAKSFAATGYMTDALSRGYFTHYPLLTSLSHLAVYLARAENPLFIYWLFYLALFCISFSYSLSLGDGWWRKNLAIIIPFLLIVTFAFYRHSGIAYTNFPYATFLISSRLYLYRAFAGKFEERKKLLFLSSILLALSIWTRANEPFYLSTLVMVFVYSLFSYRRKRLLSPFFYLVPVLSIYVGWFTFTRISFGSAGWVMGRGGEIMKSFLAEPYLLLKNTYDVLIYLSKYFVYPNLWALLSFFIISLLLLLVNLDRRSAESKTGNTSKLFLDFIFNITLWLDLILLVIGVYVFSIKFEVWKEIGDSLTRMMMFFSPLVVLHVISTLKHLIESLSGGKKL